MCVDCFLFRGVNKLLVMSKLEHRFSTTGCEEGTQPSAVVFCSNHFHSPLLSNDLGYNNKGGASLKQQAKPYLPANVRT